MFCSNYFVSSGGIPGCVPPTDRASLVISGLCGKTVSKSSKGGCSNSHVSGVEFLSLRCSFRNLSSVCYASFNSNSHRRNPDFSRPNKNNGFSQNWNRKNEEKEESLEPDSLSSRNGPFPSFTGNKKSPATAVPGPREREIVELFRKVQAQLRERSAAKEEKKIENAPTKSKESENVDSLLKLLRKHSAQQVKKNGGGASAANDADFIVEDSKQAQEPNSNEISENHGLLRHNRPKSSFQKRSPVPQTKPLPVELESELPSVDSPVPESTAEVDGIPEVESEPEIDVEDALFDESSDDETTSELYDENDDEYDDAGEELNAMKLTELRALAKSRGLKGFSKLKKSELIHLLSQ